MNTLFIIVKQFLVSLLLANYFTTSLSTEFGSNNSPCTSNIFVQAAFTSNSRTTPSWTYNRKSFYTVSSWTSPLRPTRMSSFQLFEKSKDNDDNVDEMQNLQNDLDRMMIEQQQKQPKPTLFGIEKKDMSNEELQVPIFTGTIILLANLALIAYGFYVFFTGEDPAISQALY